MLEIDLFSVAMAREPLISNNTCNDAECEFLTKDLSDVTCKISVRFCARHYWVLHASG